jgi:hypothetical protein
MKWVALAVSSVNGCSLKTDQNLIAAKAIKPAFIMFETGMLISINPYPMLPQFQMPPGVP